MTMEEWRDVVGYEGLYQVSSLGKVRSLSHFTIDTLGRKRFYPGKILQSQDPGDGHAVVNLCQQGRQKTWYVHVLSLTAFVGPCPPNKEGCHNNGDGFDNDITNLRWDTHSANMRDALTHGTNVQHNRLACPREHLLKLPNLIKSTWEKEGRRGCLACSRARANEQTAKRLGWPFNFKDAADRHYRKIMGLESIGT
jgi:hypothetical protein